LGCWHKDGGKNAYIGCMKKLPGESEMLLRKADENVSGTDN
jgi:hypothetical protein